MIWIKNGNTVQPINNDTYIIRNEMNQTSKVASVSHRLQIIKNDKVWEPNKINLSLPCVILCYMSQQLQDLNKCISFCVRL